jgi:hypothetical protein
LVKHGAHDLGDLASLAQVICEFWPTKVEIAILTSQVIVRLAWFKETRKQKKISSKAGRVNESEGEPCFGYPKGERAYDDLPD